MLKKHLSVVVPVYSEAEVIEVFHSRVTAVMEGLASGSCNEDCYEYEIVYVDDGSKDNTLAILNSLRDKDPRISIVDLSRNFGKEIAMSAGLEHAIGDAAIVIDADLQDPPELIPKFIDEWRNGYDVVYAQRIKRDGESWLKKGSAKLFYRILGQISHIEIPKDTGDFRLLSRRSIDALKTLKERHRYMKGLFSWIGYPQKAILYSRDPRESGKTKWGYWKLGGLAIEGITSFSDAPLKISSYIGVIAALCSLLYAIYMIARTLVFDNPIPGYPSLIVIVTFLGGIQLISLGVIGEYLGRTYNESKRRPLYFTKAFHPSLSYKSLTCKNREYGTD